MIPLLPVVAAFAAGAINAVAGGGTLLTFPSLLAAGLGPVAANATSTLALVPGSFGAFARYRGDLAGARSDAIWMIVPSLAGGLIGALLVVRAGDDVLRRLVPWLILGAAGLIAFQEPIKRLLPSPNRQGGTSTSSARRQRWIGAAFQLLVAIYGGFFGAGIGILMLAALSLRGIDDVHRMNGLKNLAAVGINGVAAISFALLGQVRWPIALSMAVTAVAGGWVGASFAKRIAPATVRRIIVAIGLAIGVWTLLRPL